MAKYLFILNPVSGKGKGEKLIPFISSYFNSHQIEFKILITEYHLHAIKLVNENAHSFDVIVVIGGDGTLNEVINALFKLNIDKIVGIIPVGSGNDFIKNADFGSNIDDSLAYLTKREMNIITVDAGYAEFTDSSGDKIKRYFINSLGMGFDAQVAHYKNKNKIIKGILSYLIAVFKVLLSFNPINVDFIYDDKPVRGKKLLCCIGNGVSSGGGFYLTPDAKINDGYLNFCLVDNISIPQILRYLPLALLNKIGNAKIAKFDIFKSLNLSLTEGTFIHLDGEMLSTKANNLSVTISDKKIKFICK